MELHTLGIDLGKTVFHLVGLNLRVHGTGGSDYSVGRFAATSRH